MANAGEVRRPVVAGQFYEGTREALLKQIEECYLGKLGPGALPQVNAQGPRRVLGLVSPHAGYMFSGPTAAHGFAHLAADGLPEHVVILGPCHRPVSHARVAIQTNGAWLTPLGEAVVDADLAEALAGTWDEFALGAYHFAAEHSLEVQVPFLQHIFGDRLRIVPIMILEQSARLVRDLGAALSRALSGRDAVIVASTDLSHYVSPQAAQRLDNSLIERMVALDPEGLMDLALGPSMSTCGYGPVAAMLHACSAAGASEAKVLAYSHSGMVYPAAEVVGYVSIAVRREE